MKSLKLPAIQFYGGDWRKDLGVQSLSYHDRGIWFEILLLMNESERRGVLLLMGRPVTTEELSRVLGLDNQILTTTLNNLSTSGVSGFDEETGALLSRRMVRDENLRQIRKKAGFLGGNPILLKQRQTKLDNLAATTGDKVSLTPAFALSASTLKNTSPSLRSGEASAAQPAAAGGAPRSVSNVGKVTDAGKKTESRHRGTTAAVRPSAGKGASATPAVAPSGINGTRYNSHEKQKDAAKSDKRYDPFRKVICEWFAELNNEAIGLVPWGAAEVRALGALLQAEPKLTPERFRGRLVHRYQAVEIGRAHAKPRRGDVSPREALSAVIKSLPRYEAGPVNTFGDPL